MFTVRGQPRSRGRPASGCRLRTPAGPTLAVVALALGTAVAVGADLPAEQTRGEQIFRHGRSPDGDPITALIGADAVELPASAVPCASCHGADGRGRPEGGVIPADITWSHLTKSYGHRHEYGRSHPAFDAESVRAAIEKGIDPAGNRLDAVMPRYSMTDGDMTALLRYLQQLESRMDPGLDADVVRVGAVLPLSGPAATVGKALLALTRAFVDDLNVGGGLHGRRIVLEVLPLGETRDEALINVEQALARDEIFALIGGYAPGIEEALYALAEEHGVPLVGPVTPNPPPGPALSRYVFHLLAGRPQQIRVLVDFAAEIAGDERINGVIAGPDTPEFRALEAAADAQARARGAAGLEALSYAPGRFEPGALTDVLAEGGHRELFFLGAADELHATLEALAGAGVTPTVFLLPDTVTPALFEAPQAYDGRVFIAYPTLPQDVTAKGRSGLGELLSEHSLSTDHLSSQAAAYAGAIVFVEALKRAGRQLSRERLVTALEGLQDFETGLTPRVSYSLNRRVGALGAHIVRLDLANRGYSRVGQWRELRGER